MSDRETALRSVEAIGTLEGDSALDPVDPLILAIDVGPVRYKRILQKMIAGEQT